MRIKDASEYGDSKGPGTRAKRANDHAAARIKARHAERDYFGRPIPSAEEVRAAREAAAEAAAKAGMRLDAVLVTRGLSPARDKAKALIASGAVWVDGSNKVKPSTLVLEGAVVEVRPVEA